MPLIYTQEPLPSPSSGKTVPSCITVFIGGFGDWLTGAFFKTMQRVSFPEDPETEWRAYYHWDGGSLGMLHDGCSRILHDLSACSESHPDAALLLCGHSYGASAAMHILRQLPFRRDNVLLLTLDAVSRRQPSHRAGGIRHWINCHLTGPFTPIDTIPRIGGRWGHCGDADMNLTFDSSAIASDGHRYAHNRPLPFLTDASHGSPGALAAMQKIVRSLSV